MVVDEHSESVKPTRFSYKIARFIEAGIFGVGLAYLAGRVERIAFPDIHPKVFMSMATLVASLGVVMAFLGRQVIADIEAKLRIRFHLSETLAPFFGHKLESTYRVLKSTTRVS
jgi:hypothetical protein